MQSSMNVNNIQIRIVAVGDGAVGKTCILYSYQFDKCPTQHIPTIVDNFQKEIETKDKKYILDIWDTAGQENYENIRQKTYPGTDVFLIIFSLVERASFENALNKWLPDLLQSSFQSDKYPILILVGNKVDLRDPLDENHVQRQAVLTQLKQQEYKMITEYLECSAVTQKGLVEIFQKAVTLKSQKYQQQKQQKVEINDKPNGVNQNYCCLIY